MQARAQFAPEVVQAIEVEDEVDIEPETAGGQRGKPVTIWVVVSDGDVYVRSVRGTRGRWYQALIQQPRGVLHVGNREVLFKAQHIDDPETVARVSEAFRQKYEKRWPRETAPMVKGETLNTTLRLEPRST